MSDTNEPITTPEEVAPEKTKVRSRWLTLAILFSAIGIIAFISAYAVGYFKLVKGNMELVNTVTHLQTQMDISANSIAKLESTLQGLQQTLEKSQSLSVKQEQLLADWQTAQQGNLNKWYAAEVKYLVRLANDHLQFAHDVPMAISLLQRADSVLQPVANPALLTIREAIAKDIADLQALPPLDTASLYLKLYAINTQVDQLPLPPVPIQASGVSSTNTADLAWWQKGLNTSWQALKQIVIVQYDGNKQLPFLLPNEKIFLYQNIHAQIETALWAILHRNNAIYQASLHELTTWVTRYFDQSSPITKNVLEQLQLLAKTDVTPPNVNLATTVQLLDNYFADNNNNQGV